MSPFKCPHCRRLLFKILPSAICVGVEIQCPKCGKIVEPNIGEPIKAADKPQAEAGKAS